MTGRNKDIFNTPCSNPAYTRNMLIEEIKTRYRNGWELNWFTTNVKSFGWEDINPEVSKFLKRLKTLDFERADVSFFNPTTKDTVYECYELVKNEM